MARAINEALNILKDKYQTSKCAIATAFILNIIKDIQVVTGSISKEHIKECIDGLNIKLEKEDWYYLYKSSGKILP